MSLSPLSAVGVAFHLWPGPALGGREKYRFYVMRVPGPSVCIYNVPNGRTLAPDTGCVQNKQRFATSSHFWRGGRQHRSKVPRVLPEHRGPYVVVISRGLFRCRRSAFAAPRGCHTSTLLMSNVWQHCGLINRRVHVCLLSSAEARRHPSEEYMLHAWLVDQLVAEPIKVAQMTAKHNRVPAAFRSST